MPFLRQFSLFCIEVKRRAAAAWEAAKPQTRQVWNWALKPRPSSWPQPSLQRTWQWLKLRPQLALPVAGIIFLLLVALWDWYSFELTDLNGITHHPHADILNPIGAALGGIVLAWAALRQARTATRQADIASERHKKQTEADTEGRLTESYSRAIEQLASDKAEERFGGIYTLEQISRESPNRYWTVMETLTAFIRARTARVEAEPVRPERIGESPAPDIVAALEVIKGRSDSSRERERVNAWRLDFSGAVLIQAYFRDAHLERASFRNAHLEEANFRNTHLEGVDFTGAYLDGAKLRYAHFDAPDFSKAFGHAELPDWIPEHNRPTGRGCRPHP
jgi:uncharacterized protein YjbI with pentapeptide repeats